MQMRDKKSYLLNYDGHLHVMVINSAHDSMRQRVLVANQKKFNPNGQWLTAKAMYRWINLYVAQNNRGRATAWVDHVLVNTPA